MPPPLTWWPTRLPTNKVPAELRSQRVRVGHHLAHRRRSGRFLVLGSGIFAALQKQAANDNNVDRQGDHDFEKQRRFSTKGPYTLADQWN